MEIVWDTSDTIAIAVSGGVDSMVLLEQVRRSQHYKELYVLHVNHQLRDASAAEADMINAYCRQHHIKLIIHTIPVGYFDLTRSIQNEAREVRYRFFESVIEKYGIQFLLTAHHKDDQVETILFRLMTNRYNYQPIDIQPLVSYRNYKLCRPLLNVSKKDLMIYAEQHNVPFMTDETNDESKYIRNYIRNDILPILDDTLDKYNLLHLADYMKDANVLIHQQAERFASAIALGELSRQMLTNENRLVVENILVRLVQKHTHRRDVSHHLINEMIRIIHSEATHATFEVAPGWHIQIAYDKLIVRNKKEKTDEPLTITSPGKYHFNGYIIQVLNIFEPITIRTRQDGDKIKINAHHQKISRILKDKKVPIYERNDIPVVCINNEIIAIGNYKHNQHPMNKEIIITKEK
ncbi:tRNA lysidine(34) synthetase TilS [Macrococcus equi]|uniref:tRNA lysidine(34) synthetase TilS n=1 Tax=Macrococcus equi TaxID=3395462 RepID=UPI0039BDCCC0